MAAADGSGSRADAVYGIHAVREALASRTGRVQRVLVARDDRRLAEIIHLARAGHVPVQVQPRAVLDRLSQSRYHQGVVALVSAGAYVEPEDILALARQRQQPPFVVLLDEVQDPQNLGAVIRTAEAAGVHGVIVPERRSAGLSGAVAKASAGAVEHLRLARVTNLGRSIEWLQEQQVWVYGLDPEGQDVYTDVDLRGPTALVFGGEGTGVRAGVLAKCDRTVRIPMFGRVASLNLSASAAIVLYEAVRQRTGALPR